MNENVKIKIVETGNIKNCPVLIGFPDVGLSGLISLSYILKKFTSKEVAHITSSYFPPIMTIREGIPKFPVRIYSCEIEKKEGILQDFIVILSEIPIPFNVSRLLGDALVKWFEKKGLEEVTILGSVGSMSRTETFGKGEKNFPRTFATTSDEKIKEILKSKGVEIIEEGIIFGINSIMMEKCIENNIKSILLIVESLFTFPDPEAAASLILTLNKIFDLNIEVDTLLKQWDEIRRRAKELMDQTSRAMALIKRDESESLPMYR